MIWAAADSPSPETGHPLTGSATVDANNQLTVTIDGGGWVWGNTHTCSTTGGKSDRYAAGYAVDWQDPNKPGYPIANSGIAVGIQGEDRYVHYNTQEPCGHPATVQWQGKTVQGTEGEIGSSALVGSTQVTGLTHTYAPGVRPTAPICLVTYDVHGSYSDGKFNSNDQFVDTAGDNSVTTNKDIPNVADRCFKIVIPDSPDLTILKTVDPQSVEVGGVFTYGLSISNLSKTADATGTTSVNDTLPNGLSLDSVTPANGWNCSNAGSAVTCTTTSTIAANASGISVATIKATALAAALGPNNTAGTVDNTGIVTNPNDSNPNNNTYTVHSTVTPLPNQLDLSITKSASAASATVGDALTYTLAVRNVSSQNTTGTVSVTDSVPAGLQVDGVSTPNGSGWSCSFSGQDLTCTRASLAAGTSAPLITVSTTVLSSGAPRVVNTGVVSTPNDTNPNNNQSTVTTPISVPAPKLSIVKTANPTSGTTVFRGDSIVYTLSYRNDGESAANDAVITDDVPAGTTLDGQPNCPTPSCTFSSVSGSTLTWKVDIPAHGSGSVSFAVLVNNDVADGAVIRNHAVLTYGGTPTNTNETQHPVSVPSGGLQLVKSVDNTTPNFGDVLTYTLTVSAVGNITQNGVVVTDVVPADTTYEGVAGCSTGCKVNYNGGTNTLTWDVGTLTPGQSVALTFATRINTPSVPAGTTVTRTIDNVGLTFSNETPPTPSNHVRTPVTAVLGVKIVKTPTTTPTTTLPFTGVGLPVGRAVTDGVLLVLAGMLMLALASGGRRNPDEA